MLCIWPPSLLEYPALLQSRPGPLEASSGGAAREVRIRAEAGERGGGTMPATFSGRYLGCLLLLLFCTRVSGESPTGKCKLSLGRAPSVSGGPERGGPEQCLGAKVLLAPQHPPGSPGAVALPRHGSCLSASPVRAAETFLFLSDLPLPLSVRGSRGTAGIRSRCRPASGWWAAADGHSRIGNQPSHCLSTLSLTYRRVY